MPSNDSPHDDLEGIVRRAVRAELHALVFKLFWTVLAAVIVAVGVNAMAIGLFGIGSPLLPIALGAVLFVFGVRVLLSTWGVTLF